MPNEFIVKNGLVVGGNVVTSGTITINGALAATQSWVTSQAYLTSASLSGYATQSYVTSAISSLIDAAPAALDTLNELAAALGDDANFSTTITNSIAAKLPLAGGTMSGILTFSSAYNAYIYTFSRVGLANQGRIIYNNGTGSNMFFGELASNVYGFTPSAYTDTPALAFNFSTNNVGIGTASPTRKLDVNGTSIFRDFTTVVSSNGNPVSNTTWLSTDSGITNIYTGGNSTVQLNSNGVSYFNGGNVGIGTSSPDTPLVVQGGSAGTGGWNRTATLSATYPGLIFNSNGTKWGGMAYDYSAAMRFWVNANNNDIFAGTQAMSILNNGNVGIATSNPIYKLQVAGSAYVNGGTLFLDSSEYLRWGNSNQGIVGVNDSHVAILSGGATRQTIYAEGRTYFPGLDLSISNINGSHGSGTYFRGDGSHFVFGLSDGNTLYLNYGNSAGILRTFGTWYHESTQILSTSRVLTNVSGNISMFTNDAGYLTSVSDIWVNTAGDTMTGSLSFSEASVIKKRFTTGTNNPVKTASGVLTSRSDNGGGSTYYIIETNVPQDDYQMGGFTIEIFGNYSSTNHKTKIDLGGYWNPEPNGGFIGFEAHGSNPQYKPTIEVARNTSGKTVFIIYGVSWNYPVIIARDLWLGYTGSDGGTYGEGWSIIGTNDISSYTNKDTVVWRNAYSDSNPAGYITGYTETDTLATVTGRGSSTTTAVTFNGGATISGTGGDGSEVLRLTGSASDAFNYSTASVWGNLTAGETVAHVIGKAESQYNTANFGYRHVADGSPSNHVTIGMFQADNLLNILGNGNVGIGITTPGSKLDVNGVITATGGNSTNWNTAYGWGNHASAGYLTSYSETDTLASVTGRGTTTSANISVNNVKIGTDGTYSGSYSTIGFGGTTNGYNRVFGNNGTADGLFLASATGRGIYFRPNGGDIDRVTINAGGNVAINTSNFTYANGDNFSVITGAVPTANKLFIDGSIQLLNNTDAIIIGRGTSTFLTDEELGFGWGGGWYMIDGSYLRVRNNISVYSTGSFYGSIFYDVNDTNYYVDPHSTSNLNVLSIPGYQYIGGQTSNGQSNYQWTGATYQTPSDWTARLILRRDNASTGVNGSIPSLVIFNNNGADQTTASMVFATNECVTGSNSVNLAGIVAKKESVGNCGGWSSGSLNFFVKNYATRIDSLALTPDGNATFSGLVYSTGYGNSSQWNTAYSWGNHASQSYATTSYVTTQINNLIAGAPGVLDTLDELAAALGDDANFATTVTNSIAGKVSKAGDTMTGALTIQNGPSATWDYMTLEHPGPYARINLGNAENGFLIAHEGTTTATFATNGNLTITGALIETSSIKVKENVKTSEGNLEKVVNLRPVTYNKIGSETTELGLIAEEVAEVYPEFVQYDENGEPIGVNYSRLTAALIGAVKELTNQVQELNKKING